MSKKPQITFSIDNKNELIIQFDINWKSENIVDELSVLLSYILYSENQDIMYAILSKSAEAAGKEQELMDIVENLSFLEGNIQNINTSNNKSDAMVKPTRSPWFFS